MHTHTKDLAPREQRAMTKSQDAMVFFVFVEGNIGSGKSTFLELLSSRENGGDALAELRELRDRFSKVVVLQEDVAGWMSPLPGTDEKSVFDLFYEDRQRYAFTFQSYVLFSRVSAMIDAASQNDDGDKTLVLCERSFLTDLEIFAKGLARAGDMSALDLEVYGQWHALVRKVSESAGVSLSSSATIYLRCPPEVSFGRIGGRARRSEDRITLEYVRDLHERHDAWLLPSPDQTRTLVVDASRNYIEDRSELERIVKEVVDFICLSAPPRRAAGA